MFDFILTLNAIKVITNELLTGNYFYIIPCGLLIVVGTIFEIRKLITTKICSKCGETYKNKELKDGICHKCIIKIENLDGKK